MLNIKKRPITEDCLNEMIRIFSMPQVNPGMTPAQIQYYAGQDNMLRWCINKCATYEKEVYGG